MYCPSGQVERTAERSGGVGKNLSKYEEVQVLSERQELLKNTMEDKLDLHIRATERYHDQIFEETRVLEEKKSEEALLLVQKRHDLWRSE